MNRPCLHVSLIILMAGLTSLAGQHANLRMPDPASLATLTTAFDARTYDDGAGHTLPYRLFTPADYDASRAYPLVLFLHGGGGRGDDNLKQISNAELLGSRTWASREIQARDPAFVVAPQAPGEAGGWRGVYGEMAVALVQSLAGEFSIDTRRLYITGQSMGGVGTWYLITVYPDVFAAAVPLCGYSNLHDVETYVRHAVPIWTFHGADDPLVPVDGPMRSINGRPLAPGFVGTRTMVEALHARGGTPKYTEYPGVGHEVWERAYREPELPAWLFAQRR